MRHPLPNARFDEGLLLALNLAGFACQGHHYSREKQGQPKTDQKRKEFGGAVHPLQLISDEAALIT